MWLWSGSKFVEYNSSYSMARQITQIAVLNEIKIIYENKLLSLLICHLNIIFKFSLTGLLFPGPTK